jgi:hypothetical protein
MTVPIPGTMTVPQTASTSQIYATIRKALLDHVTSGGLRLSSMMGTAPRVFIGIQPPPPIFPYLTLLLDRTTTPGYNGYRETAILEVQAIGKPESQRYVIESAMDVVDDCLTQYLYSASNGLIVCRDRRRQTVPVFTDPAEAGVVSVVSQFDLFLWPRVLTAKAD